MSDTSKLLRYLREKKGLSQADCAKALGIDRTTYAKYENGGSVKRNVEKISAFFGVSTDTLLRGLLGDISDPSHPWNKHIPQQAKSDVAWNPPPEFFTNPETGKRIADMNLSDTHKRIILASKDLSPEELDRIADLVETMAKAHRK